MKKYLFLDDERSPKDVTWVKIDRSATWHIVRSYEEARKWVLQNGFPDVISFDHDLGNGPTGYDFAKWLVEYDMNTDSMPGDFTFTVHSMNPVGADNIKRYFNNYLRLVKTPKADK